MKKIIMKLMIFLYIKIFFEGFCTVQFKQKYIRIKDLKLSDLPDIVNNMTICPF